MLAVLQVGAVVTRISAGRISDAMQARIRPLRWIGLASAAGVLLTAVVTDAPVAVVVPVMVVAGAISMAWNGLSVTAAAELAGRARSGAAIGFQQTTLASDRSRRSRRLRLPRGDDLVAGRLRARLDRAAGGLVPAGSSAGDPRLAEFSTQDRPGGR